MADKKHIALVDDDINILTSLSIALKSEGYQITTYTNGEEALAGILKSPPDLAILDIKMPRMDGIELIKRLNKKADIWSINWDLLHYLTDTFSITPSRSIEPSSNEIPNSSISMTFWATSTI